VEDSSLLIVTKTMWGHFIPTAKGAPLRDFYASWAWYALPHQLPIANKEHPLSIRLIR
jgi:hypothetical protein